MSIRHVNNFIRVYERFGNRNPGTDLPASITVLNLLTSFTDEQLEQEYELPDGTRKKPVDMSRRQIEELKRQLRQAEQIAEAERKERERLEQEHAELARYIIEESSAVTTIRANNRSDVKAV